MTGTNEAPLARELATYARQLAALSGDEGKFALIAGDEVLGVFDTYGDALTAGYQKRGLEPFLVKQISTVEIVANFTRNLQPA